MKLTTKDLLECISVLSIAALLLFVAHKAKAETNTYLKFGVGYILSQPDYIEYNQNTIRNNLHYSDFSAHIEAGFQSGDFSYGIHYAKGDGIGHDPSKLEAFVDYDWIENNDWQLITGIGYKLIFQEYTTYKNEKVEYNVDGKDDDFSARIGLSRSYGVYEIGLWHHSQWFTGAPINETWEYHKTEITIGLRF